MNKRTGLIAGAAAVALVGAAILLPHANASDDRPPEARAFAAQDATRIGRALAADLGDGAAGWYYDGGTKRLVVNVVDDKAAGRVRAEGAVARVVPNSMASLTSATRTLGARAAVPGTAWSIDPRTNKVVVIADRTVGGAKLDQLTKVTKELGGTVTVRRSSGEFKPFHDGPRGGTGGTAGS
ncbi:S1 family peptidase, partial [Streptomyces sp. URMC 123]|uniref:S1 family peptidase n=1 Tax=Streptomyces sp. URMC 123 TaxID=3423403 RepID=UPI003F1B02D3